MSEQPVSEVSKHCDLNDTLNHTRFLSNDEIRSHKDCLQKERDVWRALYNEKRQLASKVSAKGNSPPEDDIVQLETGDLEFISEAPDYQQVGELFAKLSKSITLVQRQHDKTKRGFNIALHRIKSSSFLNIQGKQN